MQRHVEWIIRHHIFVIIATVLITVALVTQMRNLAVIMDTSTLHIFWTPRQELRYQC